MIGGKRPIVVELSSDSRNAYEKKTEKILLPGASLVEPARTSANVGSENACSPGIERNCRRGSISYARTRRISRTSSSQTARDKNDESSTNIVNDRTLSFLEAYASSRSVDYILLPLARRILPVSFPIARKDRFRERRRRLVPKKSLLAVPLPGWTRSFLDFSISCSSSSSFSSSSSSSSSFSSSSPGSPLRRFQRRAPLTRRIPPDGKQDRKHASSSYPPLLLRSEISRHTLFVR